jgi:hypothetical protein
MYRAWPRTKGMFSSQAEIGQPIPAEHAFDADDNILPIRLERLEKGLGFSLDVTMEENVFRIIKDAEAHFVRMQVNSAVILVGYGVESSVRASSVWAGFLALSMAAGGSYASRVPSLVSRYSAGPANGAGR